MICNSRLAIEARVAWQRSFDLLTSDDPAKRMKTMHEISEDIWLQRIRHPLTVQMARTVCHVNSDRITRGDVQ
ncbi:MAG: hypothetical protein ACMZ66_05535 [Thalassospira sp.]|uniref:hypothetical protein n=1 Tax=Thalassospira sp. TaxID=1912094 RepID=UPI003A86EEC6